MTDLQDEAKKFIEQNHFTSWSETLAAFAERERGKIADELDKILLDSSRDRRLAEVEKYAEQLRGEPNE